ncbi:MAG: hypothetical protein AAGB48_01235 [Planctomycetota bacterium]
MRAGLACIGRIGCAAIVAAVSVCGCSGAPRGGDRPASFESLSWLAFAPVSLRISPLTRLETGPSGAPALMVYFELFDSWDHTTKALGHLRVELFRRDGNVLRREEIWFNDLTDPRLNSQYFDVTGLYRLPLEAPEWLLPGAPDAPEGYRVRVFFAVVSPEGELVSLSDLYDRAM